MQLSENLHREDLSQTEKAHIVQKIHISTGEVHARTARIAAISRQHVYRLLAIHDGMPARGKTDRRLSVSKLVGELEYQRGRLQEGLLSRDEVVSLKDSCQTLLEIVDLKLPKMPIDSPATGESQAAKN